MVESVLRWLKHGVAGPISTASVASVASGQATEPAVGGEESTMIRSRHTYA